MSTPNFLAQKYFMHKIWLISIFIKLNMLTYYLTNPNFWTLQYRPTFKLTRNNTNDINKRYAYRMKLQRRLHDAYTPGLFWCKLDISSFGVTVTLEPPTKLQSLCKWAPSVTICWPKSAVLLLPSEKLNLCLLPS